MTQARIPGLDPAIQERAGLTDRQTEAMRLWNPEAGKRSGGYRSVARCLGISRGAARDRIEEGLRKIALALDEAEVHTQHRSTKGSPRPDEPYEADDAPGIRVFAD